MTNIDKLYELEKAIEGIKFTPAQEKVLNFLFKGYIIKIENKHHISGGQMVWFREGTTTHAGKIYKAFFNTFYKIKKAKGIDLASDFII